MGNEEKLGPYRSWDHWQGKFSVEEPNGKKSMESGIWRLVQGLLYASA